MQLNEEACPVPESVLGQLYRASPQGLPELIETVSPDVRAMLAVYCYRRSQLAAIGRAIAASCEEEDLSFHGGNLGVDIFAKSRAPLAVAQSSRGQRQKISLSKGALMSVIAQNLI
jgi:hypothetical protein